MDTLGVNPLYMWTPSVRSSNAKLNFIDDNDNHVQLFARHNYTAVYTRTFVLQYRLPDMPEWSVNLKM